MFTINGKSAAAAALLCTAVLLPITACTTTEGGAASQGETKIGLVLRTLSTPQWQAVEKGAKAAAEERGVELLSYGAKDEHDVSGQINAIEDMLAKGANTLIVAVNGTSQLVPVLSDAHNDGVKIVFLDSAIPDFPGDGLILSDNEGLSKRLSEQFINAEAITGKVGSLDFPGISSVMSRASGAAEVIQRSGLELAAQLPGECDRTKAINVTEDMLQANPEITAIWGNCDRAAVGAVQAIKTAGKLPGKDVKVVGFDGQPEALQLIQSGELYATVVQDFDGWGTKAVETLVELREGKPVQSPILMDADIVTKENVSQFK